MIRHAATLPFLFALFLGCSSSKKEDGPPDTAHYAKAVAESFCDALKTCCNAQKIQYDESSCKAQLTGIFQGLVDVVKRGKVIYNPSAVAGCQAAFKAREGRCSDDAGPPPGADAGYVDAIAAACFPVFKGTVPPGEACSDSAECAAPSPDVATRCQSDPNATGGRGPSDKFCFQARTHALPGEACSAGGGGGPGMPMTNFTQAFCEPSVGYCNPAMMMSAMGVCKGYANVGDACGVTSGARCNPALAYCDFRAQKCAAIPGLGGDCSPMGSDTVCAAGLFCDTKAMPRSCAPKLPEGAVCASDAECAADYCTGLPFGGAPGTTGRCDATMGGAFSINPRTCGFGPNGSGKDDAGILPPAKGTALGASRLDLSAVRETRWYAFPRD